MSKEQSAIDMVEHATKEATTQILIMYREAYVASVRTGDSTSCAKSIATSAVEHFSEFAGTYLHELISKMAETTGINMEGKND